MAVHVMQSMSFFLHLGLLYCIWLKLHGFVRPNYHNQIFSLKPCPVFTVSSSCQSDILTGRAAKDTYCARQDVVCLKGIRAYLKSLYVFLLLNCGHLILKIYFASWILTMFNTKELGLKSIWDLNRTCV